MKESQAISRNYDVSILCMDRRGVRPRKDSDGKVQIHRLKTPNLFPESNVLSFLLSYPIFFLRAVARSLSEKPDVMHSHDFDTLLIGLICSRLMGIPLVYDVHEVYAFMIEGDVPQSVSRVIRRLENILTKKVDYFITVNEPVADHVVPPGKDATIVMNCIDIPRPVKVMQTRDVLVLFYGGELGKATLLMESIDAVESSRGWELRLAGKGALTDAVREKSEKSEKLRFMGYLNQEDYYREVSEADVMLCALNPLYRNNKVATPIKLLEAMAYGIPALVVKDTFSANMAEKYGNGVVVEPTINGIKKGLEILEDQEMRSEMGKKGREVAERILNWQVMCERLLGLYRRIENERR